MEWNQSEIIEACKKQDEQAQMALFHRYRRQFHGLVLRYVNNKEVAEEVLMDAFIIIFSKIKVYKDQYFESWMKSIVVHKSIDYYRKHKNDPVFYDIEGEDSIQISQNSANKIETEYLLKMLHFLPAGYRMVFNLHAIEGYQHKEIAKQLGISVNTSKTQLHKAKLKLQTLLEKGGYNG